MPQNPAIVGAKTSGCEVYVFDSTKQAESKQRECCDPDLRLTGHDKEGYGLSWSPFKQGYLVSGSHYNRICLWDVSAVAQDRVLGALRVYEAHESVVEDVSWHLKNENLFGSVGDDCQLIVWDLRTNQIQHSVKAHEKEINSSTSMWYQETCLNYACFIALGMELSLGLWENFAAISVLVVSYVKCNGKREDSLAVSRAVIQHIILAAILAMLDDLDTKALAVALSPIIPSIVVLVTPKMEKLDLEETPLDFVHIRRRKTQVLGYIA